MRTFGFILLIGSIILGIANIVCAVDANASYTKFEENWHLADKASTIQQKAEYLDKFVDVLEKSGLQGMNAAQIYKSTDTDFDENLRALKSLQSRLHEIQGMEVSSLAYQTAIQQITAQEQGEASKMLEVFKDCWWRKHHTWLWGWRLALNIVVTLVGLIVGIAIICVTMD